MKRSFPKIQLHRRTKFEKESQGEERDRSGTSRTCFASRLQERSIPNSDILVLEDYPSLFSDSKSSGYNVCEWLGCQHHPQTCCFQATTYPAKHCTTICCVVTTTCAGIQFKSDYKSNKKMPFS